MEGELNRRLAVLAVLYHKRRTNTVFPEVSLAEIEERMGFPRDYLDFTLWYLQKKGYVVKADNAQYALTAEGVDFVETERVDFPTLNKLLTSGSEIVVEDIVESQRRNSERPRKRSRSRKLEAAPSSTCAAVLMEMPDHDRRISKRTACGSADHRQFKAERRIDVTTTGETRTPRGQADDYREKH